MTLQIHEALHRLNDNLINLRTVVEASDKFMQAQYKRHILLIGRSQERIDALQKQIDEIMVGDEAVKVTNGGTW